VALVTDYERVDVCEELSLSVVCQDEWYGRGELPTDISLDDAELVFDHRGDPYVRVEVSAEVPERETE